MIRGRVANVIKGFSRDRDHMLLVNFECVRGFDAEWKLLRRSTETVCRISHHFGPTGISALTVPTLFPVASSSAM